MSALRISTLTFVALIWGPPATVVVWLAMLCPRAGREIDAILRRHQRPTRAAH